MCVCPRATILGVFFLICKKRSYAEEHLQEMDEAERRLLGILLSTIYICPHIYIYICVLLLLFFWLMQGALHQGGGG